LVVMRAVDPQVAQSILYRPNAVPAPLIPPENAPMPQQSFPDYTRQAMPPAPIIPQPVNVDPRVARQSHFNVDPRRMPPQPHSAHLPPAARDPRLAPAPQASLPSPSLIAEQEKAQLIMQVLQLSDQEINMLPPEQRQSILLLKEQISRTSN